MIEKKKREKNRELLNTYHKKNCEVYGCRFQAEPAHIKSRGAGGDDSLGTVIALCRVHHSLQHQYGWDRFTKLYPEIGKALKKKGWVIKDVFGIRKLVRAEENG